MRENKEEGIAGLGADPAETTPITQEDVNQYLVNGGETSLQHGEDPTSEISPGSPEFYDANLLASLVANEKFQSEALETALGLWDKNRNRGAELGDTGETLHRVSFANEEWVKRDAALIIQRYMVGVLTEKEAENKVLSLVTTEREKRALQSVWEGIQAKVLDVETVISQHGMDEVGGGVEAHDVKERIELMQARERFSEGLIADVESTVLSHISYGREEIAVEYALEDEERVALVGALARMIEGGTVKLYTENLEAVASGCVKGEKKTRYVVALLSKVRAGFGYHVRSGFGRTPTHSLRHQVEEGGIDEDVPDATSDSVVTEAEPTVSPKSESEQMIVEEVVASPSDVGESSENGGTSRQGVPSHEDVSGQGVVLDELSVEEEGGREDVMSDGAEEGTNKVVREGRIKEIQVRIAHELRRYSGVLADMVAHVREGGVGADGAKKELVRYIKTLYNASPTAERFIPDPNAPRSESSILLVDDEGEVVSLRGVQIDIISQGPGAGTRYIRSYTHAVPLTGPHAGETLTYQAVRIPKQTFGEGEYGYAEMQELNALKAELAELAKGK